MKKAVLFVFELLIIKINYFPKHCFVGKVLLFFEKFNLNFSGQKNRIKFYINKNELVDIKLEKIILTQI